MTIDGVRILTGVFFWFDRHMKSTLYQYNLTKKIQVTNRSDKLTKKKLSSNASYQAYGTNVPQSITGSRTYWQSRYLDLLAMTAELGQPTFFITLTQNDSWDELQIYLKENYGDKNSVDPNITETISPVLFPAEMTITFFERFKLFRENVLLSKTVGPLGIIKDYWWRIEFQKRGGLHVHMVVWCNTETVPINAVLAEMPRGNSFENIELMRNMVKKYQLHTKCCPERCFKGPNGKVLTKCKYGFPALMTPHEKLDDSGVRYLYTRRHLEDKVVVPYNMCILLLWDGHMNIQKISHSGWQMYLAKYLAKSEPSFNTKLTEEMSDTECYLRTRIVGKLEVMTHLLHFNICRSSREIIYIPTDINPKYRFLKRKKHMPENDDSEDIFYDTLIEKYLERPEVLSDLTYPKFVKYYRYCQPSESFNQSIHLTDQKGRVLRKRKDTQFAIPRFHFVLPFGEDQELYFMQLMLLNLPLNKKTIILSQKNKSQTYMEECVIRNLLKQNDLGMQLLTSAFQRGFSFESLSELASKLKDSKWISDSESAGFLNDIDSSINNVVESSEMEIDHEENNIFVSPPSKLSFDCENLTKSQEQVYKWLQDRLSNNQQTLACITGAAGTGKSYMIKGILNLCEDLKITTAIMGTTGIAAWLIGGCTIHCFFKMNIECQSMIEYGTSDHIVLANTELLIIDEFTMMESQMLINIDKICRKYAANSSSYKLFGGKHVILVGDPAQLPAINTPIYHTQQWFHFNMLVLRDIVRQSDDYFINILHKVRRGHVDKTVNDFLHQHLSSEKISDIDIENTTLIVSLRKQRDNVNKMFIEKLSGDLIEVKAIDTDLGGLCLDEATSIRLQSVRERLDDIIRVKVNARVMLTKNIAVKDGWVNGTIAIIKEFSNDCFFLQNVNTGKILPLVRTKQTLTIPGCSYSIVRQQFPIVPAYAMTVHKVQGLTLKKVHVQLDSAFFASGQAYVAMSRVTDHKNLTFLTADPDAIFIAQFYQQLLNWIDSKNILESNYIQAVEYPEKALMKTLNKLKTSEKMYNSSINQLETNVLVIPEIKTNDFSESLRMESPIIPPFPLPITWRNENMVKNCNLRIIDHLSHPVSKALDAWFRGLNFKVSNTFSNQQFLNTCGYNACYAALKLRRAGSTFMNDMSSSELPDENFYASVNAMLGIKANKYQDLTGDQIIQVISSFYEGKSLNWFDGPLSLSNFIRQVENNYTNYIVCKRPCPIRLCVVNTSMSEDINTEGFQGDHWIVVAYSLDSCETIADNQNPDD